MSVEPMVEPDPSRPLPKLVRTRRASQRPSFRSNRVVTWTIALILAATLVLFRFRGLIRQLLDDR